MSSTTKQAATNDAAPKLPSFKQMEAQVDNPSEQRNMTGSLEQCKEELRDAYMNFKDLQMRCVIDLRPNTHMTDEIPHTVYYFKPETFLLDDPEKQRQYRDSLLKKVSTIPKPDAITYLGDDLHRSMCQTIADRSTPKQTKSFLCEFFKRRQYSLQHMKYKLLCRWAHHNMTSECIENISTEATFIYGKLEFNLEQAMLRNERLDQEDFYDQAMTEQRPSTKSEPGGSALYVEKFDLNPHSLVREDDIEVYIRGVAHRNKINKLSNKFISRLKWLPMKAKYDIFENAIGDHFNIKNKNLERQNLIHDRVKARTHKNNIMTPELEADLNHVLNNYHCKKFEKQFMSGNDRTMHYWKANHDEVPRLVADQQLLKIKISDAAIKFNLTGDIELDNGYSFSYQVTVFFPGYFQKQVLKSQFSVYDLEEDPNAQQKRTLNNMSRIDTNIFRDVSTQKNQVPSDEAIQCEMKNTDIKILRLKSSAFWIDYVAMTPNEPDWHQKQQALLNADNPIDTLLKSGFNFLDVNDLASVNRINEDNATMHMKNVQRLNTFDPNNLMQTKPIQTTDGEKIVTIDKMPLKQSSNVAGNIEAHLLSAVQEPTDEDETSARSQQPKPQTTGKTSLHFLQQHLLIAYYTLRFISSRDSKTRLMYTLNYFRAIQKRLALDLREFATRDKIDAHYSNPFIQSKEANQHVLNQANFSAKAYEQIQKSKLNDNIRPVRNMMVFDEKVISEMKNMATLRQYKCNGLFSNKILQTCPSYPKFHAAHGEPLRRQTEDEEMDRSTNYKSISEQSIKLMGRIEFIEINEHLQEVYVKDDFGIYIIYDCVFQDIKCLEDELIKVGSLYIHKAEVLSDPSKQTTQRPFPAKDRLEVIDDLLQKEAEFQFQKVKLIQVYMECYEHVTDPLEQQKLMQVITDIMARRPRLNLNANYFMDAYDAEIKCIKKQFELIKMLVDLQITLEKTENKRLQDSLNLSFQLANTYSQNRWQYQDAESLLRAMEKTRKAMDISEGGNVQNDQINANNSQQDGSVQNPKISIDGTTNNHSIDSQQQPLMTERARRSSVQKSQASAAEAAEVESTLEEENFGDDDNNKFTQLLGLPQITLESIYQSYREKDHNVLKQMSEHSHFIQVHEGYPEFLTRLTHRSILDKNRCFKPNTWSQDTGSLDFYETLDFVTKFYSVSQQMQQELYDGLKVNWDSTLMTQIDIQVAELSMQELKQVVRILEGSETEYKGRALVEDEQIMGNSEKMIFYAKEMISDLSRKPKHLVDPFLIAKLDLDTIKFFEFPKVPQSLNKYTLRKSTQVAGADFLIQSEKNAIAGVAKFKAQSSDYTEVMADLLHGNVSDAINRRNIVVPSMLKTYCNMMELHRLRSEIILAVSECAMLGQVYTAQCEFIGQKNNKLVQSEGISFDRIEFAGNDQNLVNFVDDGPAHHEEIDLAIAEFDCQLLSNVNFRNPDSFKINIITSGLEEVRAILQYELMQKHLLIVATRLNSLLIDTYQRSFSEMNLIQHKKVAIPNSNISYVQVLNRNQETYNGSALKQERLKTKMNMSSFCLPIFYNITNKKSSTRGSIAKEFSNYQTSVVQAMPHDDYCIQRVTRCFKLKLLTRFVQQTLTEIYLDAQKVQALQSCQRLRHFARYFMFDPKKLGMTGEAQTVFKYESSPLMENFPTNYLPEGVGEQENSNRIDAKKVENLKVINNSYEILDYTGIPSSSSLMTLDASPMDDMRTFKQKRLEIRAKTLNNDPSLEKDDFKDINPMEIAPETHLKSILPTFNPVNMDSIKKTAEEVAELVKQKLGNSAGTLLDYNEALYFGDSKYAQLSRYYVSLERIITVEWFINKLQFRPSEVIHIDNAIECGLAFWQPDEFDQRVLSESKPKLKLNQINTRAQEFFFDQICTQRQKRNMAEVVSSLALTMKSFITQYQKTRADLRFDYLSQYTEFRYQQVIGSMHKLVQQFYYQKNVKAVNCIRTALAHITKMNHMKVVHLKPNNYSVSSAILAPEQFSLESGNMIYGSVQYEDTLNFRRCVQPVVNEKALEPAQVSLFQSMYQHDYLRRNYTTQFAGQFCSTAGSIPFKALDTALLGLSAQERVYSQTFIVQAKYQANDFMETVFNDTTMAGLTAEDCYSLNQLIDAKKFMNETTQALLLRNALICWFENSTLPDSAEKYEQFESNFRQNFFWKQLEQKEELTKKLQLMNTFGQIPTQAQLKEMRAKIDTLVNDQSLATQYEAQKRDALVKSLREEFTSLKKKVTLDNYFNTKAEIHVFSNEIEKFMIRASVKTLDSECTALAKCFTMQVPSVQYHIHPFQQFAATFYDHVDPQMHLDICNKINAVQTLLTKLRNRSTEVETLTSGPGMVVTIKDFNDILIDFCKTTIKDQEKQFKSRQETSFLIEENYRQLVYFKDQKIKTLEHRINNIGINLDNIIDARLFEKGNHLIYELDSSNRVLSLFKNAMYSLERNLVDKIHGEQLEKFKRKNNVVELKTQKFAQYKDTILNMINADFAEDQDRIKVILKQKAEFAKNTDRDGTHKPAQMYPAGHAMDLLTNKNNTVAGEMGQMLGGLLTGAVVPKNFEHYSYCSCYQPDPRFPRPTMELAELEMLSEAEARHELSKLCTLVRKQRILYRTKEMCMGQKFQNKINLLTKQLNNNGVLWEQLAESEKRERVLKQELLHTQQSLSTAEKTIQNLKDSLKVIDAERGRLMNFKSSKVELLKELEARVKKFDLTENIDTEKLVAALRLKDQQLQDVEGVQEIFNSRIEQSNQRRDADVGRLKRNLQKEQTKTQSVVDKMEQMKIELKMLETNDSSVGSIWKKKCIDLFEVCQSMKHENDELRSRCKELINQGIALADAVGNNDSQSHCHKVQHSQYQQRATASDLPDLQMNQTMPSVSVKHNSTDNRNVSTSGNTTGVAARSVYHRTVIGGRKTTPQLTVISADSARKQRNKTELGYQDDYKNSPIKDLRQIMTQQRGRTIEQLIDGPQPVPAPLMTGGGTNILQSHQPRHLNDIKAILQNGGVEQHRRKLASNGNTRATSFMKSQQPQQSEEGRRVAEQRRQSQTITHHQDSIFNTKTQSIKGGAQIEVKDQSLSKSSRFRKPTHILAFDLQGKALANSQHQRNLVLTDQTSQQSQASWNVQKIQMTVGVDYQGQQDQVRPIDLMLSSQRLKDQEIIRDGASVQSDELLRDPSYV